MDDTLTREVVTIANDHTAQCAFRHVRAVCGEGRPLSEGRAMALRLAQAGIAVEFYTDAGLGAALRSTETFPRGWRCPCRSTGRACHA